MLRGLMIFFIVLLHGSVCTQEDLIEIYFPVGEKHIVLNGSDIPVQGTILWEWTPHCGQPNTKTLVKMTAEGQGWRAEWGSKDTEREESKWHQINDSLDIKITNAAFEASGLFTCRQTEPEEKILKQYDVFAIKVERHPRYQFIGSDVTLSCTISRLSGTVSLQWKERNSPQHNRRKTDQIRLNNKVYLIVQDFQEDDAHRYACKVQDNGRTVLSVPIELHFSMSEFGRQYTSYWPIFGYNSLNLNCKCKSKCNVSVWYRKNVNPPIRWKIISSADKKEQRNTNILEIQNRIILKHFDGMSFPLQIYPAQFEDAGTYRCTMDTRDLVTIELITTKVSAIPSHSLSDGDSVSLTCSVSHVNTPTRLVWMNNGRKILVKEKTFNSPGEGNNSLSLFIQKIGQHNRNWTCLVFNGTMLKIYIAYKLEVIGRNKIAYLNYVLVFVVLVLLLCIIATIMSYFRRINEPANKDQREPNFSNIIPDSEPNTEEIHYASVIFQKRKPDSTLDEQSNLQPSDANRGSSDGSESFVVYGTVIK
ncbi:uncharacterized protein [Heterodontus francisci]|uniref:uncharacterized protein n=1 Tax=Heterodontus francisci TaxID=7792 RepID=UPI00355B70F4